MKKIVGAIFNLIVLISLLWILMFSLFFILGIEPYAVLSGSMEPAIHVGSLCMVDNNAVYEEIKEGDVVAFQQGKMRVTHRVLKVYPEGLETKGDANKVSDGITTTKKNYIGKSIFSIPNLGYVFRYMSTKIGLIIILVIVCIAGIGDTLLNEIKRKEKEKSI